MRRILYLLAVFMLITGTFIVTDVRFDLLTIRAGAVTVYVGSGPGNDTETIQEAVDMAEPGDTIYVHAGTYPESLQISKTLTLKGEDKSTTIIDASDNQRGIYVSGSEFVNITGFTVKNATQYNMFFIHCNRSEIKDNVIKDGAFAALGIFSGSDNLIEDNTLTNNLQGILISSSSHANIVSNNVIDSTGDRAVTIQTDSRENRVEGNHIEVFNKAVYVYESENTTIADNHISNGTIGVNLVDLDLALLHNNEISGNDIGMELNSASVRIENCTILSSITNDIVLKDVGATSPEVTLVNTTFDEDKVLLETDTVGLTVKWFLHVRVINETGKTVPGITVRVRDNQHGNFDENYTSDANGYVRWMELAQYRQTQTGKLVLTPHNITVSSETASGYAAPEVSLDQTKTVTVKAFFDSDGDGVLDILDAFPLDSTEWVDTDRDGVGDNSDVFPNDASETADSDSDGVGDNADDFPNDPTETKDSDDDGHGDNSDAFPDDAGEWKDSDGDGVGDNSDFLPEMDNNLFYLIIAILVIAVVVVILLLIKRGKKSEKAQGK
ncbi:MAG: right-handed parallel beta-helix repeat-containing protein [Thermoplasmata archaeon]|nr:MAG: right-handed parallel beta-helix repeat-containing protein [Thermoplasmata archaeon]